jgi:hypothetical protein
MQEWNTMAMSIANVDFLHVGVVRPPSGFAASAGSGTRS